MSDLLSEGIPSVLVHDGLHERKASAAVLVNRLEKNVGFACNDVDRARLAKLHLLAQVLVASAIEDGQASTVGEVIRRMERSEEPRLRALFRRFTRDRDLCLLLANISVM